MQGAGIMALEMKLDLKKMPKALRIVLTIAPAAIILILVLVLIVLPKTKEIKTLNTEIAKQDKEITTMEAKVAKIDILKAENEKLQKELVKLNEKLPEEKEISSLLKQISETAAKSDVDILSWKPEAKKSHPSGIIEEVPFAVSLSGTYHNLGYFFSNLTRLNRIVNLSDIKLSNPKAKKDEAVLSITFMASTFTAVKGSGK